MAIIDGSARENTSWNVSEIAVLVSVSDHLAELLRIEHCTPSRRCDRDKVDAMIAGRRSGVLSDRIVHLTRMSDTQDQVQSETWRDRGCVVLDVRDLADRRLDDDQLEEIARRCLANRNQVDARPSRPIDDRFDYSDRTSAPSIQRAQA